MAMEQELYKEFQEQLVRRIFEIQRRNKEQFLELITLNQNLIDECEKHTTSSSAVKFIYPFEIYFKDVFSKINTTASIEQQFKLLPYFLYMFGAFNEKVKEVSKALPNNKFKLHLCTMNKNIQALLQEEPMKIMQEKIANRRVNQNLILIIKHLKANISRQKNDRQTDYYSQWKVDLFTQIQNKLSQTDSLTNSELVQYLADIREVCGKKRNAWHFWSEPHSVAEFEAMLKASSLTDISSDTTSEPEPAPGM